MEIMTDRWLYSFNYEWYEIFLALMLSKQNEVGVLKFYQEILAWQAWPPEFKTFVFEYESVCEWVAIEEQINQK